MLRKIVGTVGVFAGEVKVRCLNLHTITSVWASLYSGQRQAGKRHKDVGVMYIFQIGIEPAITVRTIAAFEILDPGDLQIAPKIKRDVLVEKELMIAALNKASITP